jgi:hypothetical protein
MEHLDCDVNQASISRNCICRAHGASGQAVTGGDITDDAKDQVLSDVE